MHHYRNLLYISHGNTDETDGLKQALSLARNNQAPLTILILCPQFPGELADYRKTYEESLIQQVETSIIASKEAINLKEGDVNLTITLESSATPSVDSIRYVLRGGHDLVIKEADTHTSGSGFKALDMDLLRKCPCPVWLCRPISRSRQDMQVAVAIDPESEEDAAEVLSKRLLDLSYSLAESCSGKLHIISCWDYVFESALRNSIWFKLPEDKVQETLQSAEANHRGALDELIAASKVSSNACHVHHLHGQPDELIPAFVQEQKVDVLVMGTVARTGIPGFMIGNTAENIVQQLSCSLLALKPHGFTSPIQAY